METNRQQTARGFSGIEFLFPVGGHREPGAQLRRAVAVDIQVEGPNLDQSYQIAGSTETINSYRAGAVDVHINRHRYPCVAHQRDREKRGATGPDRTGRGQQHADSLSSSALIAPSYFLNPANNVNYIVACTHSAGSDSNSVHSDDEHALEPAGIGGSLQAASNAPRLNPVPQPQYERWPRFTVVPESVPAEVSHYTCSG